MIQWFLASLGNVVSVLCVYYADRYVVVLIVTWSLVVMVAVTTMVTLLIEAAVELVKQHPHPHELPPTTWLA